MNTNGILMELSDFELLEIDGGNWKEHTWNVIQNVASGVAIGGAIGGVPGAIIGAHYGAVAYAIGYAYDKTKK